MRRLLLTLAVCAALADPATLKSTRIRIPAWVGSESAGASNFVVRLNGEPARVLSVRGPREDLLLLVVLDLTGDLALVDTAKEALKAEIERLPNQIYVGLLRAPEGLSVLLDPTGDRAQCAETLQGLPVGGKAGLLETVETVQSVADSILEKTAVRVAVLFVTDSDIQNYREDYTNPVINSSDPHDLSRRFPEALVQEKITRLDAKVAASQTPLFVVHLNYRSDRLNEAYQIGLKRLVETTAGASAFCRSAADIPSSLKEIFETIRSHYSLSVELPKKPKPIVDVHMTLGGEEGRELHYRSRLRLKKE